MKKVTLETVKKVKRQQQPGAGMFLESCAPHCFICDEDIMGRGVPLLVSHTSYTKTGLPTKIGQLMGDGFMVVVSIEDMLCKRCGALLNHLDKLESDLDIVKRALTGYLKMKYGLLEDTQQIQKVKDLMETSSLQEISTPVPDDVSADIEYILSDDSHESELEVVPLYTENNDKRTVEIVVDEAPVIPRNAVQKDNKDTSSEETAPKLLSCMMCDFKTTEQSSFHSHLAACSELPFRCTVCEKIFESDKHVRNHFMEAHLSIWTCHFCNKNFREQKDFTSHMTSHLGHNSTISKIQVEDPVSLEESPHNVLGSFECNICDYQSTNKRIFDDHVRKHVVLKLFQCKICKERFQHKQDLAQHVQEHKSQIFKCEVCSSEFDKEGAFLEHRQVHEVMNSKCDTLEKLVNENNITLETVLNQSSEGECLNSLIAKQEDSTLNDIEFHSCHICSLTFVSLSRFLEHAKMHKQNEVFSHGASQLLQHDIHSIDCEGRQEYVDLDESLEDMFEKLHAEAETEKAGSCNVCEQAFVSDEELHLENNTDKIPMLVEEKSSLLEADKVDESCKVEQISSCFNNNTDAAICISPSDVMENVSDNLKNIVLEADPSTVQETQTAKEGFIDIFDMVREKKLSCNDDAEIDHTLLQSMCEPEVKIEHADDKTMDSKSLMSCEPTDSSQNDLNTSTLAPGQSRKTFVCAMCRFRTPVLLEMRTHLKEHNQNSFQCTVCRKMLSTSQKLAYHLKSHNRFRGKMTCPYCYQEFADKYRLQQHLQDKHQKDKIMYKCCFCNETFNTKKAYKAHEEEHPERFTFKCDKCDQSFMKEKQLFDHNDAVHRDPHCRFCGKEITKAKTLRNHELRHIREKDSFECDMCKRVFKTKTGLRHHVAVHTGEYKYCCDFCGRGFMSRMMMEEHLSMHTKEERYICDVCGRKFSFQSTYWIHRKWHDNPYPYKCNFCSRKFRHSSLLAVHKRKHTGERPYKCPHCPLTFPVGGTLKRHLILHTGVYPFNCESCKRGFTTRHKYATHLAKVHGDFEMLHAKPQQGEFKMVIRDDPKPVQPPTIWEVADDSMNFKLENIGGDDEASKDVACTIVSDDMLVDNIVPTRVVEIVLDETSQAVATVTLAEHANILPDIWYQ